MAPRGTAVAGESSGYVPVVGVMASAAWKPTKLSRKTPIAANGAVNRPGKSAPAVNPITATVTNWTTPTATGHSGGPPQVASRATWI
jgi:hypothetical protein